MELRTYKYTTYNICFKYSEPPLDVPDYELGIYILRDFWLQMPKNRPEELQEIYEKYLEEVKTHLQEKWENRERDLIDMKVLKPWYLDDWKNRTVESTADFFKRKFSERNYFNGASHVFTQLLSEQKVFIVYIIIALP